MNNDLLETQKIEEAINHFNISTNEDLYNFMEGDDDVLKQIALLNIQKISSRKEAESIVNTLTNHPSETREYCSFLVNRLMKDENCNKYFCGEKILHNIERAIFDVNPKVCRKIIEILPYYEEIESLYPLLIKNSFDLIELLQEKNKNKNYLYNKKSFHLYWHVFALGYTLTKNSYPNYRKDLLNLLNLLLTFKEYTLREKGAYLIKTLKKFDESKDFIELYLKYANDENFYVKEIFA